MTEKSTFARRVRTWFLARMVRGRRRYASIGSADAMTIPEARREARRLIASYIEPAKTGNGPRTPGHPMDAFAAEFLERYARHWKPRTLTASAYVVRNHILPAFGHMTVDAIAVEHVRDWFASMSERSGSANHTMPELWGYRAHNSNPCKNTRRYKTKPVERFLTADEMARLNAVLTCDEFWCPHIVAIVRLLTLTGCRHSEVFDLRWRNIGADALNLEDSKTGPRAVPLGKAARALIETLPGPRKPEAFLFPSYAHGKGYYPLRNCWRTVCSDAKLGRLRLHDLRHTAASQARICHWSESCSAIGGTGPRRVTLTLPMPILSRRRNKWEP